MLPKHVENEIAESIYPTIRNMVYDTTLELVKGNEELTNYIADECVNNVKECYELGMPVFIENLNDVESLTNNFFIEGFEGDFGVDSWVVLQAMHLSFTTFYEHMVHDVLFKLCDMGYLEYNDEGKFRMTDKEKKYTQQLH